jgi:PAS domain S-box-containing protein
MATLAATDSSTSPFGDDAMRQMLHSIDALVLTLSADGKIRDCNLTCAAVTGFSPAELVGRNIASAFSVAEEVATMRANIDRLLAGDDIDKFETYLLTKSGDRKRVRWSGILLETPGEPKPPLLLTGIDTTREFEAIDRMNKAEATTARLQQKLKRLNERYHDTGDHDIERRTERRLPYPRRQRIAPYQKGELPHEDQFFVVECRNIGARGIAFFLDNPPNSRTYIVELGNGPHVIYLSAEVKHATLSRSAEKDRYLVGCQFGGRITG